MTKHTVPSVRESPSSGGTPTPAPIQPVELADFADLQVAEQNNTTLRLVVPSVRGVWYEAIVCACICPDRTLYHGHQTGRANHFYTHCAAHGVVDCGRAQRLTSRDEESAGGGPNRNERRRKSGYTTTRWYQSRGL